MLRGRVAVWLLLPVLLPLAACVGVGDRARGQQQMGLTLDATGTKVVIVIRPCPGQSLSEASLWEMNKKGSMRQRQLWGVTATASPAPSPNRLVVGESPEGYRENHALADALRAVIPG